MAYERGRQEASMSESWEIRNIDIYRAGGHGATSGATIRISGSQILSVDRAHIVPDHINATGLVAIPGVIDPHVHFRIPGWEHKEDWTTGSRAALRGGVTTVFDMPNTREPLVTAEGLIAKEFLVGKRPIDYRFWIGATADDNSREISEAARYVRSRLAGVKIYMGSSTGNLLVTDELLLRRYFEVAASSKLIVGVHCEDEGLIQKHLKCAGSNPHVRAHCQIRNTEVEVVAVTRALRLQEDVGCALYLCHISTPEAVELAADAKDRGATVYVEVCPHHFILCQMRLDDPRRAPYYKMNPPLRRLDQMLRLREYVMRDGFVDTIGSDHAPHTHDEKLSANYDAIPSGVPGVETLLQSLLQLGWKTDMRLEHVVELTSYNAAHIFGLPSKGDIAPGYDADIVLIDPVKVATIRNEDMATKCGWTPFHEMFFRGTPTMVISRGVLYHICSSLKSRMIVSI